jgi:hypothetical protein
MFIEQRIAALEETVGILRTTVAQLRAKLNPPANYDDDFIINPTERAQKRTDANLMLYDEGRNKHVYYTVSNEKLLEITEMIANAKNPLRATREAIQHLSQ